MGLAETSALAVGIDRFADQETRSVLGSRCLQARDWGHAKTLVRQMSRSPRIRTRRSAGGYWWLATGGLELMPDLLQTLTWSGGRLLGCSLEAIRFAKSVDKWACGMKSVCAGVPDFRIRLTGPGRWHRKRNWADQGADFFWQRHIDGQLCSALYLLNRGQSQLVGTTRLWVNPGQSEIEPFGYLGNEIRTDLGKREVCELNEIGSWLAQKSGFRGLVGIDYFENGNVCPIEINPRCTASVELVHATSGHNLWLGHVSAVIQSCIEDEKDEDLLTSLERDPFMRQMAESPLAENTLPFPSGRQGAKRIFYHRGPTGQVTAEWLEQVVMTADRYADIQSISISVLDRPQPGTVVHTGEPLLTLLLTAETDQTDRPAADRSPTFWLRAEQLEKELPELPPVGDKFEA